MRRKKVSGWYNKWKGRMPFSKRMRGGERPMRVDVERAKLIYVLIKNGVPGWKVDPNGYYRRAYKYLVGWHNTVTEDGEVLRWADPEIKRLHDEGVL